MEPGYRPTTDVTFCQNYCTLYVRHMAVWVTKGLLNNMVSFFILRTLKLGGTNLSRFLTEADLQRCMSSNRNTTPGFRLGSRLRGSTVILATVDPRRGDVPILNELSMPS